ATFGTDLPERQSVAELEEQEARVTAVEEAEPVAPLLDLKEGPGLAVDDHGVAKELRIEDRRDVARAAVTGLVRDERDIQVGLGGRLMQLLEEGPIVGIEQRAVGVEGAVLDGDRDLVVLGPGRIAQGGRRPWEDAGALVARAAAEQVEAGRPGIDVGAGHP